MTSNLTPKAQVPARKWKGPVLAIALLVIVLLAGVQDFLAVSTPIGHGVLVVEGWIPDSSFADALETFRTGTYTDLVIVGGSSHRVEGVRLEERLVSSGTSETDGGTHHTPVFLPLTGNRNRTYATALTFRSWADQSHRSIQSVDVFTEGVHARKSWILFRKALGGKYSVGIISGPERSYDPNRWLLSRRGLLVVSRNVAGYCYFKAAILADNMGWNVFHD